MFVTEIIFHYESQSSKNCFNSLMFPELNLFYSQSREISLVQQELKDNWHHINSPPSSFTDKENKVPALKKVEKVCSIPMRSSLFPSYFHSFGMTENFIVFVEQPFKLDIIKLGTAYFRGDNWGNCLKFDKDDIVGSYISRTLMTF